jgi:hypothetical protein
MSGVVLRLDRVTVILIESIIGKGRLGGIGRWSSITELRVVEKIGVVVVVKRSIRNASLRLVSAISREGYI